MVWDGSLEEAEEIEGASVLQMLHSTGLMVAGY
jgi:hypothetical protein